MNEFKYEEDKRLLGYVLVYELYKNQKKNLNRIKILETDNFASNKTAIDKNYIKDVSDHIYEKRYESNFRKSENRKFNK